MLSTKMMRYKLWLVLRIYIFLKILHIFIVELCRKLRKKIKFYNHFRYVGFRVRISFILFKYFLEFANLIRKRKKTWYRRKYFLSVESKKIYLGKICMNEVSSRTWIEKRKMRIEYGKIYMDDDKNYHWHQGSN